MKKTIFKTLLISVLCGIFCGGAVFLFKILSALAFDISHRLYLLIKAKPSFLPLFLIFSALLGIGGYYLIKYEKICKGGGIPNAIAAVRGIIEFKWLKNLICVFACSFLTFVSGVPLGNEGPAVLIGATIGKGNTRLLKGEYESERKYIMAGASGAGFSIATGSPLSAIAFVFEEICSCFSPLFISVTLLSVGFATLSSRLLFFCFNISPRLFDLNIPLRLPLKYAGIGVIIGIVCGAFAVIFLKLYKGVDRLLNSLLKKIPLLYKMILVFMLCALSGFLFVETIGSGHHLILELIDTKTAWHLCLLFLLLRALFLILANTVGVSGGIFIPTLTLGALIGSVLSISLISLNILPDAFYAVPIIIGMTAFLGSALKMPITAFVFSLEALGLSECLIPTLVSIACAFLVVKLFRLPSVQEMAVAKYEKNC